MTARTLLARPCRPDAGRFSTLPRPVRSKQDSDSPERTACIGVALVGRTEDIDQSTLRDLRCRGTNWRIDDLTVVRFAEPARYRRAGPALPTDLAGGTDGGQNHGRRSLDAVQRLRERLTIAAIQMNVVLRGPTGVKPDSFADDEGHGLRFEFASVT